MRFVKIGDIYFNPMQIELIKPDVYKIDSKYVPNVEVWTDGKAHSFEGGALDLQVPDCFDKWEALGIADAMTEKVVSAVNEAMGGGDTDG